MSTTQQYPESMQRGGPGNPGPLYKANDPRRKNPFYAGLLSFLPGLGQVYVGYYRRGFINIIVAATIFSVLTAAGGDRPFTPGGIFFLIFFVLYGVIDAVRRATMYNLTLDGIEQIDLPDELTNNKLGGSYLGGGALLLFGVIALSNTAFGFSLDWLNDWWPILPMGFGAFLVYTAYQDAQNKVSGSE